MIRHNIQYTIYSCTHSLTYYHTTAVYLWLNQCYSIPARMLPHQFRSKWEGGQRIHLVHSRTVWKLQGMFIEAACISQVPITLHGKKMMWAKIKDILLAVMIAKSWQDHEISKLLSFCGEEIHLADFGQCARNSYLWQYCQPDFFFLIKKKKTDRKSLVTTLSSGLWAPLKWCP